MKVFLCSSTKQQGNFLFWRWEQWEIGGGGGVQWYFLNKEIYPGDKNILWKIFEWQFYKKDK